MSKRARRSCSRPARTSSRSGSRLPTSCAQPPPRSQTSARRTRRPCRCIEATAPGSTRPRAVRSRLWGAKTQRPDIESEPICRRNREFWHPTAPGCPGVEQPVMPAICEVSPAAVCDPGADCGADRSHPIAYHRSRSRAFCPGSDCGSRNTLSPQGPARLRLRVVCAQSPDFEPPLANPGVGFYFLFTSPKRRQTHCPRSWARRRAPRFRVLRTFGWGSSLGHRSDLVGVAGSAALTARPPVKCLAESSMGTSLATRGTAPSSAGTSKRSLLVATRVLIAGVGGRSSRGGAGSAGAGGPRAREGPSPAEGTCRTSAKGRHSLTKPG